MATNLNEEHQPAEPSQSQSVSLIKRLAGPSTTKAGLALDQTEINRIIAEASKGSKFYENEKKKDKELTIKIDKILKERDDVLKQADIAKVERAVDHLLVEIEMERDLSQCIVHVDMDAFFASVELMRNPSLAGKAFATGGGVLTTASYEARKFGVRSGMAGHIAKKLCPHLIFVKMSHGAYSEMSKKVMDIFRRYDPTMQVAGCDEGYLNITQYCREHDMTPDNCVSEIRATVKVETTLTVSAGIAPNKMLAKICSDKNKPNGQFHLPFERKAIMEFMHELSIRKVQGVGRVHERLLESIGIKTCGDIFTHRAIVSLMDRHFGLRFLLRTYLGIGSNIVQPGTREERKSIGAERTFSPLSDPQKLLQKLEEVAEELESDMQHGGWTGRTITLKYKLNTYQVFTRAKALNRYVSRKEDLLVVGKELLEAELPLTLRLIGLRVTKLKDLRLDDTKAGIKRFFDTVESSPGKNKRRRLASPEQEPIQQEQNRIEVLDDDDDDDDAMPGFHESQEHRESAEVFSTMPPEDAEPNEDDDIELFTPTPVPATPAQSSPTKKQKPRSSSSSSKALQQPATPETDQSEMTLFDCPICGRAIESDEAGQKLNEHIDWCLSRDVIKEAQAQAKISDPQRGHSKSTKPSSKGRARKRS